MARKLTLRGVDGLKLADDSGWILDEEWFLSSRRPAASWIPIDNVLCAAFHVAWWNLQMRDLEGAAEDDAMNQVDLWQQVFDRAVEGEADA